MGWSDRTIEYVQRADNEQGYENVVASINGGNLSMGGGDITLKGYFPTPGTLKPYAFFGCREALRVPHIYHSRRV